MPPTIGTCKTPEVAEWVYSNGTDMQINALRNIAISRYALKPDYLARRFSGSEAIVWGAGPSLDWAVEEIASRCLWPAVERRLNLVTDSAAPRLKGLLRRPLTGTIDIPQLKVDCVKNMPDFVMAPSLASHEVVRAAKELCLFHYPLGLSRAMKSGIRSDFAYYLDVGQFLAMVAKVIFHVERVLLIGFDCVGGHHFAPRNIGAPGASREDRSDLPDDVQRMIVHIESMADGDPSPMDVDCFDGRTRRMLSGRKGAYELWREYEKMYQFDNASFEGAKIGRFVEIGAWLKRIPAVAFKEHPPRPEWRYGADAFDPTAEMVHEHLPLIHRFEHELNEGEYRDGIIPEAERNRRRDALLREALEIVKDSIREIKESWSA